MGASRHLLDHRMTSALNLNRSVVADLRTHVGRIQRPLGQRGEDIELGSLTGRLLDSRRRLTYSLLNLLEQLRLDDSEPAFGIGDPVFRFLELFGKIAFRIDEGLLADIVVRYEIFFSVGDFDEVTENLIVFDLQIRDPGPLPLVRFDLHQVVLAVFRQLPDLVKLRIPALFDLRLGRKTPDLAVALPYRLFDELLQVREHIEPVEIGAQQRHIQARENPRDLFECGGGDLQRDQVRRIRACGARLRADAFEIVDLRNRGPELRQPPWIRIQLADPVLTSGDRLFRNQRRFEPVFQKPAPGRGLCQIQHRQQAPRLASAPDRLRKLEIDP